MTDHRLSVDDLVHIIRRSKCTIDSWVSKYGWRRSRSKPVKYVAADAIQTSCVNAP
ncbi:hypothetical protein AB0K52_22235 [Glycomyces sp. NPDC049804]|uniref:hypothetical protein n=1 Tax=Glycomyces sp. NPDC049804 TaxID=3154363 RepID=UPI00341E4B42